jgi:hypothetical protein
MPIIPTMLIRAFARTSDIEGGSRRGTAAARATAYDREATSAPEGGGEEPGAVVDEGSGEHPGEEGPGGHRRADAPSDARAGTGRGSAR